MANLIGLAVARNTMAGFDVRSQGLASGVRLVVYGSQEVHSSIEKAVQLLGIGTASLRLIPVNSDYQIDLNALRAAVATDRSQGLRPICVVGNAGTVNTGAVDDLESLADICKRENLWFHVDGAFGAFAALSPQTRAIVAGMNRADSLAFDLHKWMYMQFEAGCVLVRNDTAHKRAFSLTPEYLAHTGDRGLASGDIWFSDYGVQLSRGFRALKIWMSMKEHGIRKYGRLVRQNVEQIRYLVNLIDASPDLELLAPAPLNIACFRFNAPILDNSRINALNSELLIRLHESGVAAPTSTTLNGKYAIRVANTNYRSRREDFALLVREVVRLGKELAASGGF